jgi:guanylate kinase
MSAARAHIAARRWTGVPLLVIISSPSGGGKSTVIRRLRKRHPEFLYSLSATTRARRAGERQGRHYDYLTPVTFERLIRNGQFAEWARVHNDYYGTPKKNIIRARRAKSVLLFDIDVQGAASLRESEPSVVSIFLSPPSWPVLRDRLKGRGSETAEQQRQRLRTARQEMSRRSEYDYWVTNDDLATCVADCEAIIRAEMLRRRE